MSGHVLRIEWHHATEFIPLSNSWIEVGASIATVEYWPDSQEIIMYIAGCTSYRREGPELTMNLGYLSSRNPMLREINGSGGGNKIIVNFETKIASAQWTDIRGAKHSGFGKSTLLDENVLDEFSYATLSEAPAPSQSALRARLLREYKSCVLSGEVTHSALDVAHLIEAGTHGDYSIGIVFCFGQIIGALWTVACWGSPGMVESFLVTLCVENIELNLRGRGYLLKYS